VKVALELDPDVRAALPPAWRRRLGVELRRMVRAAGTDLEVGFRLCGDPAIHALNRDYRGKDRPTDLLAFAMSEGAGGALHPELLGDVVISLDTARRQARRKGVAGLHSEVLFLASHGLCHLLGYDHQDDAQEAEMNARMASLLAKATGRSR